MRLYYAGWVQHSPLVQPNGFFGMDVCVDGNMGLWCCYSFVLWCCFAKWGSGPMCYLPLPLVLHAGSSISISGFAPLLRIFYISYVVCNRAVFWRDFELHIGLHALLFLE